MSNSLRPCRLQHAKLPCPSPSPRICSNSCLLSQWCHPTISWPSSPSVALFSFCHQSFLVLGSFYNKLALHIKEPKYWRFSILFFSFMGDSCFAAASNTYIDCLMDITTKGVRQHTEKAQNTQSRELCSRFDSIGQEIGSLGKWMNFMTPLFSNT